MCKINLTVRSVNSSGMSSELVEDHVGQLAVAAVPTVGSELDLGPLLNDSEHPMYAEVVAVAFPVTRVGKDVREPVVTASLSYQDRTRLFADLADQS